MSIETLIPGMSEDELENLQTNATRIAKGPASKQQAEAERLLPIIADALIVRRGVDSAASSERKAARAKDIAAARAKRTAQRKATAEAEK